MANECLLSISAPEIFAFYMCFTIDLDCKCLTVIYRRILVTYQWDSIILYKS